jgi:hypothetical protein
MKRLCILLVLLVTASSAQADSISFSIAGHRIRVEAPRNCRSTSCASISIPGVYESRRKRWDDEDRDVVAAPPLPPASAPAPPVQQAPPPAPIPSPAQQVTPPAAPAIVAAPAPASRLTVVMVPAPTPLAAYKPAAATTQEVAPPPPAAQPPVVKPVDPKPAAPLLNVLREDEPGDSPIGDWQTENKGLVRIAECGRALCGYAIKPGDDAKGEAVLINMKPKTSVQWTGSVYSKDSGDTYYGSIKLNGSNTLRVEACAFGRFYCNGNHWTRVPPKPDRVITSRQIDQQPRS